MARILFFAFDIAEAAQIRRIESLRALGHDIASMSFRRNNMNRDYVPDWPDVALGRTENGRLFGRLGRLAVGLCRALRHRRISKGREVWIARNLDMLLLAVAFRALTGQRDVRLGYECLDIHGLMTRAGPVGAFARWVERRMLARVDLLILSSPGFMRGYFEPIQKYQGSWVVIENKLWAGVGPLPRPSRPRSSAGPLVLGWVGSLRCGTSLTLLEAVAREMGTDIRLIFRGSVHRHAVPDFDAVVARNPNIDYGGTYEYPHGLTEVYGASDLVWSQDLWQAGGNSDWLLPNRIYEASFFGCPSIAVRATETGRRVAEDRLGFTVSEPSPDALVALLLRLSRDEIERSAAGLLARPDADFRLTLAELDNVLAPLLRPVSSDTGPVTPDKTRHAESLGA